MIKLFKEIKKHYKNLEMFLSAIISAAKHQRHLRSKKISVISVPYI